MATFKYKGKEYGLKTTLRTAYAIQEKFNHKPYAQIFEDIDHMPIEKQISILFVAFNLENPGVSTEIEFLNEVLDNVNLSDVSWALMTLVQELTFSGMTPSEVTDRKNAIKTLMQAQAE